MMIVMIASQVMYSRVAAVWRSGQVGSGQVSAGCRREVRQGKHAMARQHSQAQAAVSKLACLTYCALIPVAG